jgi:hypothetical protein
MMMSPSRRAVARSSFAAVVLLATAACSSPSIAPLDAGAAGGGGSGGADAGALPDAEADAGPGLDASPGCAPEELGGGLIKLVKPILANLETTGGKGSQAFVIPSNAERDAFAKTVLAALDGDGAAACALPASYRWIHLVDPVAGGLYVIAEVTASGAPAPKLYWGVYASLSDPTSQPARPLVVEAPHPIYDYNTDLESTDLFVQTRARYLLLAGAHRCADVEESGCTGTTPACGVEAPYRISDVAHSVASPFYGVHVAVSKGNPTFPFLQLHGNSEPGCPGALLSDVSGDWPGAGLNAALATSLEAGGVVVGRCGAGYPTATCDLCGGGNVEARATAGSSSACTKGGSSYGRFVHIEQAMSLRQTPKAGAPGYQRMIDATLAAIPAVGP